MKSRPALNGHRGATAQPRAALTDGEQSRLAAAPLSPSVGAVSKWAIRVCAGKRGIPVLKRTFDIASASLALGLLVPLLVGIAILVKSTSPGPVLYAGLRIGYRAKPYRMYKFRSMVANAATVGPTVTADDDERITAVGRLLRRTKLDELPQLFNVLKGDMSIVGPRPEVVENLHLYDAEASIALLVKPGLTDWATLYLGDIGMRLRGSACPERDYFATMWPQKRRLQLEYVAKLSFWTDLKIIFLTLRMLTIERMSRRSSPLDNPISRITR